MRRLGMFDYEDCTIGGEHFYTKKNREYLASWMNEWNDAAKRWERSGHEENAAECRALAADYATLLGECLFRYYFRGGSIPGQDFYDRKIALKLSRMAA